MDGPPPPDAQLVEHGGPDPHLIGWAAGEIAESADGTMVYELHFRRGQVFVIHGRHGYSHARLRTRHAPGDAGRRESAIPGASPLRWTEVTPRRPWPLFVGVGRKDRRQILLDVDPVARCH